MGDDLKKLRHSDDAATSHKALAAFDRKGSRLTQGQIVLRSVIEHPGCTAPELEKYTRLTEYQVRRRLTDLRNAEKVEAGPERKCTKHGTPMLTWYEWGKRPTTDPLPPLPPGNIEYL